MSQAIQPQNGASALAILSPQDSFMPALSSDDVLRRHAALCQFRENVLREGVDFGVIPGTGQKPTLLKPGAEKLCTLFGLTTRFEIVERIEDWTGKNYDSEAFFYYLYRASLWRGGLLIAESDGSCNSRETKYRYRKSERVCPSCGAASIIKGKAEYGGGYICFAKKGGCGAKFKEGDVAIEGQIIGKVANSDIADVVNTIQKMAQKRALVAATLIGVNASEFFTQDIEDFAHHDLGVAVVEPEPEAPPAARYDMVADVAKLSNGELRTWCDFVAKQATDHPQKDAFKAEFQRRRKARAEAKPEPETVEGEIVEAKDSRLNALTNNAPESFLTFVGTVQFNKLLFESDADLKAFEIAASQMLDRPVIAEELLTDDWDGFTEMLRKKALKWGTDA